MLDPTAARSDTGPGRAVDAVGLAWEQLRRVIDPEVGVNIVDLGLVYDLDLDEQLITVTMTMTTPACPLGPYLQDAVGRALGSMAGPRQIEVVITFDPPWRPEAITPQGRAQLGWAR